MKVQRLNESYSAITAPPEVLKNISDYLKVERPGAYFDVAVKRGFKSPYDYFAKVQDDKLIVMNGHIPLLQHFGVPQQELTSDYTPEELETFLTTIKQDLPFSPYDYQEIAFRESILNVKQVNKMCTSSGKSLTISLIAEFFRQQGKKGLILVPTISLLSQFKGDINDYNLTELYNDTHIIGGGSTDKHFNNSLTISTWQSMQNWYDDLHELDYVICDECHRFTSDVTGEIIQKTVNCKFKVGFTGTIPEDPVQKMELLGLFGLPKTYVTARDLIDRNLATPVFIKSIIFDYSKSDKQIFKEAKNYAQRLTFIKEHEQRTEFIINLACKVRETGNTLVLGTHVEHIKLLFIETMKKLYPDVQVENKNITGKKSFEFQEQYGVYYLSGTDDAKTREKTRNILEEHSNAILVSNYQILSTGVNIKRLHNLVLAAPLKSYTTITQSIGRMMRLHPDKKEANIFDCVDNFGIRKPGGVFYKQYEHRKATSYNSEGHPVQERHFNLF